MRSLLSKWSMQFAFCVATVLLISTQVQAATFYFHNDHLGTPQVLTDNTQQVVWKGEYDPFGKATETVSLVEQNIRFPGQYYDQETELYYNYFRSYDPNTGRYIESDPIGLAGGINTFGYVGQSPILFIDSYGLNKRKTINLGKGFTGGIDTFNFEGSASFEIHVFDPSGKEVGMFGPDGWFNKHGLTGKPEGIPDSVENQCKGNAVEIGRKMKKIPPKGSADISNDKWKQFFRAVPILGMGMEISRPSVDRICELNPSSEACM